MSPEQWRQIKTIVQAALEVEPEKRARFVAQNCAEDKFLRREVESLLASYDKAGEFIQTPAFVNKIEILASDDTFAKNATKKNVSRYEIRRLIGKGGMGEVYLAEDARLQRKVALKVLPPDLVNNRDRLNRFEQEARAASALNHPNIITIYEIGESDDTHFIATEYIEGETLHNRLKSRRISLKSALDIAIQIASALQAAHAAGIVHRDIKPENVMIRPDGLVKILDFGIAKLTERRNETDSEGSTAIKIQTNPGMIIGTASYMSPEQARGLAVDARTDIFSFGAVLYEMLSGRQPFEGENAMDVISSILKNEPAPLGQLRPDVPHDLERIVNKALRKDREERYQTAKDLLIDLKDVRQDLEFQNKLERTAPPNREEAKTEVFNAATSDNALRPTSSSAEYIVNGIKHHKRIAVLGLVSFITALAGLFFFLNQTPALTEKDTILLTDFVNTTGDAVFDQTLKQALAVQLGQSPYLNIFSDERARETLKLMNRRPDERITKEIAREISERQGIKAILTGSISNLGNNYVINLEAINSKTGDAIAREQVEVTSKEQVLVKVGEAATKLREKLGESLQSIEKFDKPVEEATTSSLEALRAYSLGREQQLAGKPHEAIPFLKRAIELDANFASAYRSLSVVYSDILQLDLASESATKAFELRERVSEREKFAISSLYYSHIVGDLDKNIETLEMWRQTYPRDFTARHNLAAVYNDTGQYEKAIEEAQAAIRLNPNTPFPYNQLANAFIGLNRFEEAKAILERALANKLDSLYTRLYLYKIAFVQGDQAGMQQQVDWARGTPNEDFLHYQEGETAMFHGQVRQAEEAFRRAMKASEQRGAKEAVAWSAAEIAFWNAFFGNCKGAKKTAADALAISRGKEVLKRSGLALAVCGETTQALSIADELAKRKFKDGWIDYSNVPMIRSTVEINRGNHSKAIGILESTRRIQKGVHIPTFSTYLRGTAYLLQGEGTEAMNEFQRMIDSRGAYANYPVYSLAHLGLARAALLAGDTAKSRKAYQDFFALWKDADADIPILIEAKREYEKLK